MKLKLKSLSLFDLEEVRQWRNEQKAALRTSFSLTQEQQTKFYHEVICNRQANARFWSIWEGCNLLGMCGLENIQWENRLSEISLLLRPMMPGEYEKQGAEALRLLFREGFMQMNMDNIYTEVYGCNPNFDFWLKMAQKYDCITAVLPSRKFYDGSYWDSLYINFDGEDFWGHENIISKPTQTLN